MDCSSTSLLIIKGSQGRYSNKAETLREVLMKMLMKPWRLEEMLLSCLLPMACSACFLIQPRTNSQGVIEPKWLGPPPIKD